MSILTIEDLKDRSTRSAADFCWHWQGASSDDGTPRMWTLDYDRGEKRSMSGPKAVFFIAFQRSLNGRLAYRCCFCTDCVNPAHIRTADTKAEIGKALARSNVRKGTSTEQRRQNIAKAHAITGCHPTSREIVLAIREAPKSVTGRELSKKHGLSNQTVSRIRRHQSHREVCA